jgi:HD-like signal output (HDOD) protein
VTTLRAAIARIGFNLARSATIAFAMSQMRRADAWHGLETHFRTIWDASARLAAMSYAVARHCGRSDADQALLAAMLHSVGKLFVLTRASRFPVLLANAAVREEIESAWHARVGRVLLTQWSLPGELLDAACDFAQPAAHIRAHHEAGAGSAMAGSLCDVLLAARYLVDRDPGEIAGAAFLTATPFVRLGLDGAGVQEVLAASSAEIASLRAALVD